MVIAAPAPKSVGVDAKPAGQPYGPAASVSRSECARQFDCRRLIHRVAGVAARYNPFSFAGKELP
jgi:hypothetical protein